MKKSIIITDAAGRQVLFVTVRAVVHEKGGTFVMVNSGRMGEAGLYPIPITCGPFKLEWTRKGPRFTKEKNNTQVEPGQRLAVVFNYPHGIPVVKCWSFASEWSSVKQMVHAQGWFNGAMLSLWKPFFNLTNIALFRDRRGPKVQISFGDTKYRRALRMQFWPN